MRFFHALAVLLALFMFVFSLLNSHLVDIFYYTGSQSIPLSFLAVAMFGAGAVFAVLALIPSWFKPRRELRKLRKERRELRQELSALRNGPIDDRIE